MPSPTNSLQLDLWRGQRVTMFYFALLLFCVFLLYMYYFKRPKDYWKKRNVLVETHGLLWKFFLGKKSLAEHVKEAYDAHIDTTHIGTFMGAQPAVIVKELDDIGQVLAGEFQSFYTRGFEANPTDLLSDNILFIEDYKRWKCIRQKLSPVFTTSKLKNMFYIMDKCARDFVQLLDDDVNMRKKSFHALYTYTTASIGAAVFGIDTQSNKSTMDSPFIDMAWKAVGPSFKTNFKIFVNSVSPKVFKFFGFKIFGDYEDFFIGAVRNVIESRRESTEKRHDFIEICLELQNEGIIRDPQTGYEVQPTVELLAAQAFFFFIAGADTSASSMHYALLNLASHPEILEKVHKEIDATFEDKESLTYNDIDKMKYLDMVINESMRMYPPIGGLQRKCTKDVVLPVSNAKIEKGTSVIIPIYSIHRDERFHPNPNVFDPERFAPENLSQMKNYSYLPFGEGNRICIGNRFARLQLKAGLAWMLRKYTLREMNYQPVHFEKSSFALRDSKANYELLKRDF